MDYMREINSFYVWLETNELSHPARNLWHGLMHIANRAGWQVSFTVAMTTLEVKTGLNPQAIKRARNELQQMGRITWQQRKGNQCSMYSIIPFAVQNPLNFDPQPEPQPEPQCEPQPEPQCEPIKNTTYPSDTPYSKTKTNTNTKTRSVGARARTTPRFMPPTVDQVTAYCQDRNNAVNPQRFVDFYAAKGWKIGNQAMKDWKAAVRTWEQREDRRNTNEEHRRSDGGGNAGPAPGQRDDYGGVYL